ncbi:MAG: clostripain-related cysteine peptidase [Polyangiales bacterium]
MRMRFFSGGLLKAALIASTAAATTAITTAAHADTWTVMIYMQANNSLASFSQLTFKEAMEVGSKKKGLTILVSVDTGKKHVLDDVEGMPTGNGVKRVLVKKGKVVSENDDVGDDMASPEGLANFITYGIKEHPADHYALMLWDHGAGWHGCCEAETPTIRELSLADITSGIKKGLKGAKQKKLDLVGFDECLMGELEVGFALSKYVDVMVASEELEPGEGMDYLHWLTAVTEDDSMDGLAVGKAIAKGFLQHVKEGSGNPSITMSVFDLSKIDDVMTTAAKLGSDLRKTQDWSSIGAARAKSDAFGGQQQDAYGLVDLGMFAKYAKKVDGVESADEVLTAIDSFVSYNVAGPLHKKVKGVSIYLPQQGIDPDYESVEFDPKWTKFLKKYAEGSEADKTPPDTDDIEVTNDDQGGSGQGQRSMLNLKGLTKSKDVAQVSIVLAESVGSENIFLGEVPVQDAEQVAENKDGSIKFDWNGNWPMVSDGTKTQMAPLFAVKAYDEDDGRKMALVEMPAEYAADGKTFDHPIKILFELDLKAVTGRMVGAFEKTKNMSGAVKIADTGLVRPYKVDVVDKGDYTYAPGTETFTGGKLIIKAAKLPDKKYMVGVHLTDYAGNMSTKLVEVAKLVAVLQAQSQPKSGCAKKCSTGMADPNDDTFVSPWLGFGAIALMSVGRRRLPKKRAS